MPSLGDDFYLRELNSIYVHPEDRFIVSLIVGYNPVRDPIADLLEDEDPSAEDLARAAATAALELTRDDGRGGTHWHVHDRETGQSHFFEQDQFEDLSSYYPAPR